MSETYPKSVNKFVPWSKAMVAGATVGKPSYPGTTKARKQRKKRRKRRRKRKGKDG